MALSVSGSWSGSFEAFHREAQMVRYRADVFLARASWFMWGGEEPGSLLLQHSRRGGVVLSNLTEQLL